MTAYTNEHYERHAAELEKSADRLGLECRKKALPHLPTHRENAAQKIGLIRSELKKEAVLWLDADCIIHKRPKLLEETDCEVAAYGEYPSEIWSGVLFFKPGQTATAYLDAWQKRTADYPSTPIRSTWTDAAFKDMGKRSLLRLPPSYCFVRRWMWRRFPGARDCVIEDLCTDVKF